MFLVLPHTKTSRAQWFSPAVGAKEVQRMIYRAIVHAHRWLSSPTTGICLFYHCHFYMSRVFFCLLFLINKSSMLCRTFHTFVSSQFWLLILKSDYYCHHSAGDTLVPTFTFSSGFVLFFIHHKPCTRRSMRLSCVFARCRCSCRWRLSAFADLVIKYLLCQQAESFPCYKYKVMRVSKFVLFFFFSFSVVWSLFQGSKWKLMESEPRVSSSPPKNGGRVIWKS